MLKKMLLIHMRSFFLNAFFLLNFLFSLSCPAENKEDVLREFLTKLEEEIKKENFSFSKSDSYSELLKGITNLDQELDRDSVYKRSVLSLLDKASTEDNPHEKTLLINAATDIYTTDFLFSKGNQERIQYAHMDPTFLNTFWTHSEILKILDDSNRSQLNRGNKQLLYQQLPFALERMAGRTSKKILAFKAAKKLGQLLQKSSLEDDRKKKHLVHGLLQALTDPQVPNEELLSTFFESYFPESNFYSTEQSQGWLKLLSSLEARNEKTGFMDSSNLLTLVQAFEEQIKQENSTKDRTADEIYAEIRKLYQIIENKFPNNVQSKSFVWNWELEAYKEGLTPKEGNNRIAELLKNPAHNPWTDTDFLDLLEKKYQHMLGNDPLEAKEAQKFLVEIAPSLSEHTPSRANLATKNYFLFFNDAYSRLPLKERQQLKKQIAQASPEDPWFQKQLLGKGLPGAILAIQRWIPILIHSCARINQ